MKYGRKAFTLIEMLIVIVIIGILAAALIPRLQGFQARARDTRRIADMRQIYTAMNVYYTDYGSLKTTTSYGGADVGSWDYSSIGIFMIFLVSGGVITSVPVDPINIYVGGNYSNTKQFTYHYYCYPNAPIGAFLGYTQEYPETTGIVLKMMSPGGITGWNVSYRDPSLQQCSS